MTSVGQTCASFESGSNAGTPGYFLAIRAAVGPEAKSLYGGPTTSISPSRTIQELAGHSTLSMTLRYMQLAPSAPREAIGLLGHHLGNAQNASTGTK
jgi:hypothetical protein